MRATARHVMLENQLTDGHDEQRTVTSRREANVAACDSRPNIELSSNTRRSTKMPTRGQDQTPIALCFRGYLRSQARGSSTETQTREAGEKRHCLLPLRAWCGITLPPPPPPWPAATTKGLYRQGHNGGVRPAAKFDHAFAVLLSSYWPTQYQVPGISVELMRCPNHIPVPGTRHDRP